MKETYFFKIEKGQLIKTTEKDVSQNDYVVKNTQYEKNLVIIDKDKKVVKYLSRQILEEMIKVNSDSILIAVILGITILSLAVGALQYYNTKNSILEIKNEIQNQTTKNGQMSVGSGTVFLR